MNKPVKRAKTSLPVFVGALCLSGSAGFSGIAAADDTDVFFPQNDVSSVNSTANPNILFVIDDSGSMRTVDSGQTESRIKRLQEAFSTIMDGLSSNTNIGLMRFSYQEGGPVVFPVSAVEKKIADVDPSFASISQGSNITANTSSEAEQVVSSGAVTVNQSPIFIGYHASPPDVTLTNAAGGQLAEEPVNGTTKAGTDNSNATANVSNPLEMIHSGSNDQWVGLRFDNLPVPADAVFTEARLVFHANIDDSAAVSLRILGEKNNEPAVFVNNAGTNAVGSVAGTTAANATAFTNGSTFIRKATDGKAPGAGLTFAGGYAGYVDWPNVTPVDQAEPFVSPDIRDIINEIKNCGVGTGGGSGTNPNKCNQSGVNPNGGTWTNSSNNEVQLYITGPANQAGIRRADTGATQLGPTLQLAYTSAGTPPSQVITGLHFANVQIPRGVTVTNAFLQLHQDSLGGSGSLKVKVSIENVGDSAAFSNSSNNISGRTWNSTPVSWQIPVWATPLSDQSSVDISSLLNTVVSRSDWCGNQAMSFKIEVDTAASPANAAAAFRRAESAEMDDTFGPSLIYSYSSTDSALGGSTSCSGRLLTSIRIAAGNDDSVEQPVGGTPSLSGANLGLGCGGSSCGGGSNAPELVGMRFPNINLPRGAVIESATLTFGANNSNTSGTSNLTIYGQNNANAPAFTTSTGDLNSRKTGAVADTVAWSPANWSSNQTGIVTPDIKTIVQDIVNLSGWDIGHAMAFIISGTGSRMAYSYNGKSSQAPLLTINYGSQTGRLTVRNYLKLLVNQFGPTSWTPSMGTLYEAARYYRGEPAFYGRTRGFADAIPASPSSTVENVAPILQVSHPSTLVGPVSSEGHNYPSGCNTYNLTDKACAEESYTGTSTYKTPITDSCQQNNIVFLTDGGPNYNDAIAKIKTMTSVSACVDAGKTIGSASGGQNDGGTCGPELARFLSSNDQNSALTGTQKVITHTIAFSLTDTSAQDWLSRIAANGGGKFETATSVADLVAAFQSILSSILDVNTSFESPGVTVNTFNRLTNRSELYFATFKPNVSARWAGNLKRYKIGGSPPRVQDKNGLDAVDPNTGFFVAGSTSFWNNIVDGPTVQLGGLAAKLPDPASGRKVYTFTGASAPSNADLTAAANAFTDANSSLTSTLLGNASQTSTERTNLIQWARGVDVKDDNSNANVTESHREIGDPLHSEPVLVTYGGVDVDHPDITVYFGDNWGFLHAVAAGDAPDDDGLGGVEKFEFIPQELLPNLQTYYDDSGSYKNRPYGLDGPITSWVNDVNGNLRILDSSGNLESGEWAYLFVGMRRGGNNYYSLDVTNRSAPKLRWMIKGGTGSYAELGQTWSRPIKTKVKLGTNAVTDAIIFSGGYDPAEDGKSTISADSQGRAIYIADALTGARLWWAGPTGSGADLELAKLTNSVPASPKVIDLNSDGVADRIYFGDTAGQVFRIILNPAPTVSPANPNPMPSGRRIAMLSDADTAIASRTAANARRFFSSPDVAFVEKGVTTPFLSIALGSGFREVPLGTTIEDRFYALRDPDTAITSDTDLAITESTLADLSTIVTHSAAIAAITPASGPAKKGFFIKLEHNDQTFHGEKALTESQTFNNTILFASFEPGISSSSNPCSVVSGLSRLYDFNVTDGTPPTGTTMDARHTDLKQQGLPPDIVLLFTPDATGALPQDATLCIGAECKPCPGNVCKISTDKTYWWKNGN